MTDPPDNDKRSQLARRGALHPYPERVTDPLYQDDPFFDARDAVQVKYEMLRAVCIEGRPASQAAVQSGFSRPTFYQARAAFEQAGMPGLLPAKKGPRRAHKLSEAVMSFVHAQLEAEPSLSMAALAERVRRRWGIRVHPRSVKRALARHAKKNS
jgi:transposase